MLPMPGLAWHGKAALRMHEFRNLARATQGYGLPGFNAGPLKNMETSHVSDGLSGQT